MKITVAAIVVLTLAFGTVGCSGNVEPPPEPAHIVVPSKETESSRPKDVTCNSYCGGLGAGANGMCWSCDDGWTGCTNDGQCSV
jgi:hypothetical protein